MDTIINDESNANIKKRKINEEEQRKEYNKGSHSNQYLQTKYCKIVRYLLIIYNKKNFKSVLKIGLCK